jgi:DNA-binding beta-propeller fold protein YncE
MKRSRQLAASLAAAAFAGVLWLPLSAAEKPRVVSPGTGTLYIGVFPNHFKVIDEATGKVTGTIPFKSGMPRRTAMSRDRSRFYTVEAGMEKVEILDIATRSTLDTFTLSEGNRHVRIKTLEPDPRHRFVMMVIRPYVKQVDRFVIEPSALVQFDLATKKIVNTVPWPNGDERENASIQFAPDGSLMYLFSEQDVLIYDTASFKQVDKWELSKPVEEGFGAFEFGQTDAVNDEPGFYTAMFQVQDPVQRRRMMGIGRVNLAAKKVDFYTLGPAQQVGFTMAPNRKKAYGLFNEIGRYEFWSFDMEAKKVAARVEFAGRPRMSLKTSSNGQVLYIYNAGNTIDLYEADTFKYMKTITLDGDVTSDLFIVPASGTKSTA